jgi:hypothetical protein
MSTKTVHVTNLESRPVTFRGNSGESFHLAPLERDREIRRLDVEGNPMVDKLSKRRVLSVGDKPSSAQGKTTSKSKKGSKSKQSTSSKKS